ncbi:MAG: glycosyltransferase [Acetivibrionales bacterium]|jgi:glycosyltransferase involved in cell wall biosynthesis
MKRKVCHITSVHNRYDVRIFKKECTSLAKVGYDVTLLVNDNQPDEIINDVRIISSDFVPGNRLSRMIYSNKYLYKKAIEIDAEIYHIHDPELLPVGNKLKRKGKKVIFDSHENYGEQIKGKTWIPKILRNSVSTVFEKYEKYSVKKYNAVISVSPNIVERFVKINPNSIMITNYPIVRDEEIKPMQNPLNAICFAGGISEQWCHDKIIKAIDNVEVVYILAGSGTRKYIDYLRSLPGWNKVSYVGKIPFEEVKNIYSKAVAGIALNLSSQLKDEGTLGNTKIFEFMEASIAVICSNNKLWKEIVEDNKCGICINPNCVEEITSAIRYILDNPDAASAMGKNGRKAVVEKYNWKTQEKELLKLYETLF